MKARQQLAEEEGSCRDFESEYLQGIDSATNDKDQQRCEIRVLESIEVSGTMRKNPSYIH